MKEISIQQLQQDTSQWVKMAAGHERIIITDGGKPIAALTGFETTRTPGHLPDREDRISQRSVLNVDSANYISEMRD